MVEVDERVRRPQLALKLVPGQDVATTGEQEGLLPAFQEDGHHVERFSDWSTPADRLLERKETRAMVRACIERLPDRYRVVLVLRDIEELSTQEVATMLDVTPSAVKVRLHRAHQALSTLLRREYGQPTVTS